MRALTERNFSPAVNRTYEKINYKKKVAFGIAFINPYGMVSAIRYSMNALFFKFIYSGMVRAYKLLEKDLIVGDLMLWVLRETP